MSHDVPYEGEESEEEEIFFGKMTLREVKKHLSFDQQHRQTFACVQSNSNQEDLDHSLKLIETQSEPDLVSRSCEPDISFSLKDLPVPLETGELSNDDSFIKLEKMIAQLSTPSNAHDENEKEKLDTTLEIVEYILQHGPEQKPSSEEIEQQKIVVNIKEECKVPETFVEYILQHGSEQKPSSEEIEQQKIVVNIKEECKVPEKFGARQKSLKLECNNPISPYTPSFTPQKDTKPDEEFFTPSTDHQNQKHPIFKTPSNVAPKNHVFGSAAKRIPLKTNAYQHIASPIAAYIKNSPRVPLVQDVKPKKPLPGPSLIPKLVKSLSQSSLTNKENCILPRFAYRSAKKTQMLVAPCKEKLPKCQFAKNLGSSFSPAVVIKHNYREKNDTKKDLHSGQEDSFADLSLLQADLSVCTQKSAFRQPKKPLN